MLNLLKSGYRSTKPHQQSTTAGQFDFPRSLFSFLTRTIIQDDFNNIWCGTQMRICIMDLTYSAAGLKPDNILIFTDFNYLKPSDIFKLLLMCQRILTFKKSHSLFKEMTSKSGMYLPHSLFYCFWKDRIDWSIKPIKDADYCVVETRLVSEILVHPLIDPNLRSDCFPCVFC
ncbi:hypothetical protein O5D80_004904 [Batrachochytrium dendrobatidis]|nr:hypothetical protein O5D80_004904 [Batrachochytrium dendrobatidis]